MAVGAFPGAGRPVDRDVGAAEEARRAQWLALAARAIRADRAARARVARYGPPVRARTVPQTVVRPAERSAAATAEPAASGVAGRPIAADQPGRGPVVGTLLLMLCGLYGFGLAAVVAVAVARYAMTEPLGVLGPVAFAGVAAGLLTLGTAVAASAVRSRSSRRD